MYAVVTSFSPRGWNQYAKGFVDSFYENFPPEVRLIAYWEGPQPRYGGELEGYNLFELEPCASFLARHRGDLVVMGRKQGPVPWTPKSKREHYSFKHDAYKFARKVFAVADAARRVGKGRLFWIDADVVVKRQVPVKFIRDILPEDVSLCYLARGRVHSELGFVGYNLDRTETHAFLTAYEAEYSEDCFLRRLHWDDCNVFDALVRELHPIVAPIKNGSIGHPFEESPLGRYMIHLKGRRKFDEWRINDLKGKK